jgi:hypothetical protein
MTSLIEISEDTVEALYQHTSNLGEARALVMTFNGGWNFAMHNFNAEIRGSLEELLELSEDERDAQLLGAVGVMVSDLKHWVGCCLAPCSDKALEGVFEAHLQFIGNATLNIARSIVAAEQAEGATKQ